MSPVWDLFINLGEMDQILGLGVKVQVILPPGERDPISTMKQRRYCKHHVNYRSKVCYSQHKTIIILGHPVTLAMTNGSPPPHGVSALHHKYFYLKTSDNGNITYGVFIHTESATHATSVDTRYMVSNKEAKSILTKIAHCLLAWWYWHWVEKRYTQSTIASLLNSFESDTADNAHDSLYDPQSMSVTSMFASDGANQWLYQIEEEFGSDLSDHDKDNINSSKEMKGKDYNLEGIKFRLSK
jgi:hypothetical protein